MFQKSLRIESENRKPGQDKSLLHYYQYDYLQFAGSQRVTPYSGSLTPAQQKARQRVVRMLRHVGENPAGPSRAAVSLDVNGLTIPGHRRCILASVKGAGTVRCINLKMPADAGDMQLDCLRLGVRYDGQPDYAVDVPVSHFFGAGHGRVPYRSLPLGTDSPDGYYCYWPMPYRKGLSVEMCNVARGPIRFESARIEYEPTPPASDAGYFHAVFHQERTTLGQKYHVLLQVPGEGHYVGSLLYIARVGGVGGLLEGDDIITVDPGTPTQTVLHGTGIEDACNGGFYYNHEQAVTDENDPANPSFGIGPYSGLLCMDYFNNPDVLLRLHAAQYRWMIGDLVPFRRGIEVKIENFGQHGRVIIGSTAFYYATGGLPAGKTPASQPAD